MEEDTLRFWIIPVICLVAVMGLFVIILEPNSFPNSYLYVYTQACTETVC